MNKTIIEMMAEDEAYMKDAVEKLLLKKYPNVRFRFIKMLVDISFPYDYWSYTVEKIVDQCSIHIENHKDVFYE